jgi:hypothetical protein
MLLTFAYSLSAYLVFHYVDYLNDFHGLIALNGGADPGFLGYLWLSAANRHLFGIDIGVVGAVIVWSIEAAITFFVAWNRVQSAIHMTKVEAVPDAVRDYVLGLIAEGRKPEEIERELTKHGWNQPEDQARALEAAQALVALMAEAEKGRKE